MLEVTLGSLVLGTICTLFGEGIQSLIGILSSVMRRGKLAGRFQDSIYFYLPSAWVTGLFCHTWFFTCVLGLHLKSLSLHGKHFTDGTISSAPIVQVLLPRMLLCRANKQEKQRR